MPPRIAPSFGFHLLGVLLLLAGCAAASAPGPDQDPAEGEPHGDHGADPAPEDRTAPDAQEADRPHGDHQDHRDHGVRPGQTDHAGHLPPGLTASKGPGFTVADVRFMQMMMGHHAQAVAMSNLVPDRDAGPEVSRLAVRIDISQRDEMAFMTRWLQERGQPVPTPEQMEAMEMPGLVSRDDMARLEAARGPDFDRLFLRLMIHHHLGAVEMVDDLFGAPRAGQDPDIFQFATDVANDQLDEINVMERILDRLLPLNRNQAR